MSWFRRRFSKEEERAQTIVAIRNFIDGSGGDWDWDDYTSVPMDDTELEAVRLFCAALPDQYPPRVKTHYCNEEGLAALEAKLAELE